MATIHKLTKDGATIFPATITDAVVHPNTGKTLTSMIKDYNVSELFPSEGIDGGNKYNLALAISVLGTHLTAAEKTGGIKLTFISSLSPYPEEEYFLGKSSWSINVSDWKQRFEVGDVVADPSGSWEPSTAEAYIDQQVATITGNLSSETLARQTTDQSLQNQINAEATTRANVDATKADKLPMTGAGAATENNFMAIDANGNIKDSGKKPSDFLTQHQSIKTINGASIVGTGNINLQTPLTFDTTPTANSTNPVTSGGVKDYVDDGLSGKADLGNDGKVPSSQLPEIDTFPSQTGQNGKFLKTNGTDVSWDNVPNPTVDQTYNASSTNAQSGTAVAGALSTMVVQTDQSPTAGSINPVQSGGVKTYIDGRMATQDAAISTLNGNDVVLVTVLPASGTAGKIYRVPGVDRYTDYMYDSNDLTTPIQIAEYEFPGMETVKTAIPKSEFSIYGFVNLDGTVKTQGTTNKRTDYIEVDGGLTVEGRTRLGDSVLTLACYDTNKTWISGTPPNVAGTGLTDNFSVVLPSNCKYIILSCHKTIDTEDYYYANIVKKGLFDNKSTLDKIGENNGRLTFNGNYVVSDPIASLVSSLPVSTGADIATGGVYIDSSTHVIKVKM